MDEIDWSHRMIGIKGARGVGKTTFLLQYAKEKYQPGDHSCLYINTNNFYVQSVGINRKASRIAGVRSERIIFICYIICGLCAGIAGIIASSRITSADSNNIGLNFELDAILAVALGGNSLGGGKFRLAGSIIGAYTIQAITTTLYALGVSTEQAPVYKAIIVIIIVAIQAPPVKAFFARRQAKKAALKGGVA